MKESTLATLAEGANRTGHAIASMVFPHFINQEKGDLVVVGPDVYARIVSVNERTGYVRWNGDTWTGETALTVDGVETLLRHRIKRNQNRRYEQGQAV